MRLERAGGQALAKLLVDDPLVQGMLVDNDEPILGLGDQVGVVKLNGPRRSRFAGP